MCQLAEFYSTLERLCRNPAPSSSVHHNSSTRYASVPAATARSSTFSDHEALEALEAITSRRPSVIAFERLFAATSRGAALINRIKADPALHRAEIRVVSHDGSLLARVSARVGTAPPASPAPRRRRPSKPAPTPAPAAADSTTAGRAGRRGSGWSTAPKRKSTVRSRRIIDLSVIGAQILCPHPRCGRSSACASVAGRRSVVS